MDTKHTGPNGITERRAAKAARQLAYHKQRMRWMVERMEENAAILEAYLTLQGEEVSVLPGGRRVALDGSGGVEVREAAAEVEYEQLELIPDLEAGAS